MSIKELREQRNALLDSLDSVKKEERSAKNDEQVNKIISSIAKIDHEIEQIRNNKTKNTEVSYMENKELEIRKNEELALNSFMRKDIKELEERAQYVNVTEDGNVLIPESLAEGIITKMEEASPVFALARKYPSQKGILKIAKETTDDQAGFVGENQEIPSIRLKFSHVTLTQKRVGAAVTLTQQLLNDAAMDLLSYSSDLLARRTVRAIEKSIFKGNGDEDGFEGILSEKALAQEGYNKVKVNATLTAENFIEIVNSLNPFYLDGAAFFVSREVYNEIAKIKGQDLEYLMQDGKVNGRIGRTLFGYPVHISDALVKADGILFGNIGAAYGVMIKKDFALKHVAGDTQQTLNGTQLVALDGYMDGAVINPEALVHASTK